MNREILLLLLVVCFCAALAHSPPTQQFKHKFNIVKTTNKQTNKKYLKMKLISLLLIASTASAFGVSPNPAVTKSTLSTSTVVKPAFSKNSGAAASPLFRDPTTIRGGAVPGWASYNKALDDSPLTAKACTSLVGWALGDVLAQVSHLNYILVIY
ncbi:MAG: hypothetical protein ACI8RD_013245 [Bacillariaceae sp.]